MRAYKLIILGKGGIGKSELVKQFVKPSKRIHSVYDPTVEDLYHVSEMIDNKRHNLEVIDVGGYGQFQSNQDTRIRECDGFLLAYGIDDRESLMELTEIYNQITNIKDTTRLAIQLVGTKLDLAENQRQVSVEEIRSYANRWKCGHIETSAKMLQNVPEAFHQLVRSIIQLQNSNAKSKSSGLCCFGSTASH